MIYNNDTMLPYDAFKKDPLGRIKLHGGGGKTGATSAPKPYDPTKEKDYIASQKYLDSLKSAIEKNNIQLTPEQIIAALSGQQRDIINQFTNPTPVADMSSWGNFNPIAPVDNKTMIIPQVAPQPTGAFAGTQSVNPQLMAHLQSMLAGSSYLPNVNTPTGGK